MQTCAKGFDIDIFTRVGLENIMLARDVLIKLVVLCGNADVRSWIGIVGDV
jgi:hypothetical protein